MDKYNNPHVEIEYDFISISDDEGEIVRWVEDEWRDDPEIITSIANAIHLAYTRGTKVLRDWISP